MNRILGILIELCYELQIVRQGTGEFTTKRTARMAI